MQRPPVLDSEIFERELALSIVKGAAATKAKELFVASRRDLDTDNLVFCPAIRTAEFCYLWHAAIIAPAIEEKSRALRNRQTSLLIGSRTQASPARTRSSRLNRAERLAPSTNGLGPSEELKRRITCIPTSR